LCSSVLFNLIFNIKHFSEMTLYNQCLLSVVLNGGYETADLVQTIHDDVAVLQCFKNKLDEWNVVLGLLTQIQKNIYYGYHNEISDEQEIVRLIEEEEDLRVELDRLRKEIIRVKDKIPSHLKDVAQKIMLWDWKTRLFI
jgi:hypothetical protein